ncbi:uncharacterized protein LOC117183013 [Belonocnema kinseyi]|uniref:uncharacterized protein LOC117183013 n=1 Tax=Belonocnema kinseyi TaxID=2817044 RepID=UPI00143D4AA6|nr:uncharacterized protein LOC117183013 [Belonocnema kinseyi]
MVLQKKPDNTEMNDLLVSVWTPDADFVFPATEINKKNLRFQFSRLQKYHWLTYAAVEDGAYCRVCILFAQKVVGKGKHERLNLLVQTCVKDWKRALKGFKDHQTKRYHLDASNDAQNFKLIYENKKNDVVIEIDQSRKRLRLENRRKLTPIICAILFYCRQGLAIRGRRDDGSLPLDMPQENDGNFRELLPFAVDSGVVSTPRTFKGSGW